MPAHHHVLELSGIVHGRRCCGPAPERPADGFASKSAPSWYAPDLPLEPVHVQLHATVDLDARTLTGRVQTTVRSTRDGARTLVLDAVGFVDVSVDGDGDPAWRYDGKKLHLTWAQGLDKDAQTSVTVHYRVVRPLTGLHFGGPTPQQPDGGRWAGTDHETERARYWLACVDHPAVRPRYDLHLTAPVGMRIVAGGALVSDQPDADDPSLHTAHWKLDWPCPSYLLCFILGELVEADGGAHDGKPIAFFAPTPFTEAELTCTFGPTADMLDWMTNRLGRPLPWPKYYQFAAPGIGGAMENISLVSWDDAWVLDDAMRAELGWLVDMVDVHEMAHTWFGDAVVCRDFAHSWLKESWATYMESVWIEETWGQDLMHAWLFAELRQYLGEAKDKYKRPISTRRFDSSWDLFDGHLYPGGAIRLHLLRRTVGDDAFWAGVNTYLTRFEGQVVETDDFRRVMEEASGHSLGRFFDQWYRSPGYPDLEVEVSHDAEDGLLTVTVVQAQVDDDAGIGSFQATLVVAVEAADGSWKRLELELTGPRDVRTMPLAQPPKQVVVDPDSDLPHDLSKFDPGDDMLVRSLTACPSVRGRLRAAEAACRLGRTAPLDALADAWEQEDNWIVRRLVASLLGDSKAPRAGAILARLLLQEQDPRVLPTLAAACGSHRRPDVAQALTDWLIRPERPVLAAAAALTSLGSQRGDAHVPVLVDWLDRPSRWDRVRKGALAGLGATRSRDALDPIRRYLSPQHAPTHTRVVAVAALADAVAWAEAGPRAQVAEDIVGYLSDDDYKVRLAAARALGTLGASDHRDALEGLQPLLSGQEQPALRRIIDGLSKRDPGKADKRLEELGDALRKLQERVDELEGKTG